MIREGTRVDSLSLRAVRQRAVGWPERGGMDAIGRSKDSPLPRCGFRRAEGAGASIRPDASLLSLLGRGIAPLGASPSPARPIPVARTPQQPHVRGVLRTASRPVRGALAHRKGKGKGRSPRSYRSPRLRTPLSCVFADDRTGENGLLRKSIRHPGERRKP